MYFRVLSDKFPVQFHSSFSRKPAALLKKHRGAAFPAQVPDVASPLAVHGPVIIGAVPALAPRDDPSVAIQMLLEFRHDVFKKGLSGDKPHRCWNLAERIHPPQPWLAFDRDSQPHIGPAGTPIRRQPLGYQARAALGEHRPRLGVYHLPAYARELNPDEGLWAWMKQHALAGQCPPNRGSSRTQPLPRPAPPPTPASPSFFHRCPLSF